MTTYDAYQEINTVEKYIECIKAIKSEWVDSDTSISIVFRGQDNDDTLLPSVLRKIDKKEYNERLALTYFRSLYKNYTSERFVENSELFSFMQHYGIPTRLLDWTENSLMALFFAIENYSNNRDKQPVVWILKTSEFNKITSLDFSGILGAESDFIKARFDLVGYISSGGIIESYFNKFPKYADIRPYLTFPLCFFPISAGNPRLVTQKGVFTIHGSSDLPIEDIMARYDKEKYLKKVIINKENITQIRNDLKMMGISYRSVFPDLDGLSKEIKEISLQ